jgi:hypothetical protein
MEVNMVELKDTALEAVAGGHGWRPTNIKNTNNSTVKLFNFSVKGSGGLAIIVTQSIG